MPWTKDLELKLILEITTEKFFVSHDCITQDQLSDLVSLKQFLEPVAIYNNPKIACNVKSDGLLDKLVETFLNFELDLKSFVFFDMSIPQQYLFSQSKFSTWSRLNEFENIINNPLQSRGYPRYKIFYYFKLLLPLFKILNATIFKRFLPVELKRKVDAFMNSVDSDINKRIILNSVLVNRYKLKDLFGVEFENKALRERLKILNTKSNKNYTNLTSLLQFEQKTYLKLLLNRLDKMSMAHSVESRVPFLDNELIDLSNRLSDEKKIFFGKSKWLIHKIAHLKLPEVIAKRKKMGFPTPRNEWLRGNDVFFSYQDDIINNKFIMSKLKVNQLIHLMKEHNQGIKDHTDVLWPLFTFDQFMKVYNLDG